MKQSKWKSRNDKRLRKGMQLTLAEGRLDAAIDAAKVKGAGFLGTGKRSVWDDPQVRAARRHRDRILRDLGKIAKS